MSIYDTLNEKQKQAVMQTDGPVLILAGAGSGKTRVLTHRVAYLIDRAGVAPYHILAITFTNKAAGEMRERVDKIVGFGAEQVWVATFHSTCVRILRRYIDRLGYDNHFTIYDADDQKGIMKEVCKKLQIDTKMLKERTILNAISSAKDELIGPQEYEMQNGYDYNGSKIAKAYREYQETLRKNNALDFDDLIMKTVELFKADAELLASYQDRFRYIMVDEYQDTNTAQFELIRLLADRDRNLCVVGDDDQSIYKFRGANIRNILDFEKVYPEACVIKLEQNYRSTQIVLDAANAVIKNNTGRKDKALWTEKTEGERIHFRQFDTAYEEADYVAADVAKKKRAGAASYGDCAVLYRTNAQARLLEERFIMEGIPYDVIGGTNFYSRREIKDVLAYLKTIDNGRDDVAVKRIINVPRRGIGASTILRVQEYADEHGLSFYDALRAADQIPTIGRSASKLTPFVTMIQTFRSKIEFFGLEELLRDVLEVTGYLKELEESDEEDAADRVENIHELINKVVAYEAENDEPDLSDFLEEVALVADIDRVEGDSDRVLLMTLHSAKGLEFPHVYLAGMEDGIFPSYMTITADDPMEIEEERRLAYVGITRAKEELTLTCAKQRMIRGETQYNPVSRFVREIPPLLMDTAPAPAKRKVSFTSEESYAENSHERSFLRAKPFSPGESVSARPRAAVRPKRTAAENQPYIMKSITADPISAGKRSAAASEPLPAGKLAYGVGDRVRHARYGEGTVLKIEPGPRDSQVTVVFDEMGQKIMYAGFAKLQKL
ncbi:MAG: UvrD-helicase domain-containing protein [Lachnospiraceae bacterium]|nr:UvrD-helicase domain-containing protein [Lachnospiraceae bacterium]